MLTLLTEILASSTAWRTDLQRYAETLNALNAALNLMIEEGDTLLIASISHLLHMAESQLMLRRAEMLTASMTAPSMNQADGTTVQTSQ